MAILLKDMAILLKDGEKSFGGLEPSASDTTSENPQPKSDKALLLCPFSIWGF